MDRILYEGKAFFQPSIMMSSSWPATIFCMNLKFRIPSQAVYSYWSVKVPLNTPYAFPLFRRVTSEFQILTAVSE
jgi:hypothetical protein